MSVALVAGGTGSSISQVSGERRAGSQASRLLSRVVPVRGMPKTKTGNKKHLPDEISAWLHGRYYLTGIGVLS